MHQHYVADTIILPEQVARLEEEEANRKPVYEDKPIIARGWESDTAAETAKEVKVFTVLTHSFFA